MHSHHHGLFRTVRVLLAASMFVMLLPSAPAVGEPAPAYRYWIAHAQSKVYQTANPSYALSPEATPTPFAVNAAIGEAEGRQVAVRAGASSLRDVWFTSSDLSATSDTGETLTLPSSAMNSFKVHYVRITRASYGSSKTGYEPDPLLPLTLANGERLGWHPTAAPNLALRGVPANTTQPFYLLYTVPEDAKPGIYQGTVTMTATNAEGQPVPELRIPVSINVLPFSVAKRSLRTSFGISLNYAMYANSASHAWLRQDTDPPKTRVAERTTFKADQWSGWFKYLDDHRVTPQTMLPAWENGSDWAPPTDAGTMVKRDDYFEDYVGTGQATTFEGQRHGFSTIKMPEAYAVPYLKNPFLKSSYTTAAGKYYATMKAELGARASQAIAYPIDEPYASERSLVERYAALVHRYAPGVKFFVTTDAVTWAYKPLRGVDIYCQKLPFFFRDHARWIKPLLSSGKGIWIYSCVSQWQAFVPNYLIDEPLSESRSQGWFAWKTRASGLLYFSVNAWRPTGGVSTYRDPYADPLSWRGKLSNGSTLYANGDGSLVYPGYYPKLGLHVEGSPPVGSLRMEALRDGLEDYEYLKAIKARYGLAAADRYVARVIGPTPSFKPGVLQFPKYEKAAWGYESIRADMANDLSLPASPTPTP